MLTLSKLKETTRKYIQETISNLMPNIFLSFFYLTSMIWCPYPLTSSPEFSTSFLVEKGRIHTYTTTERRNHSISQIFHQLKRFYTSDLENLKGRERKITIMERGKEIEGKSEKGRAIKLSKRETLFNYCGGILEAAFYRKLQLCSTTQKSPLVYDVVAASPSMAQTKSGMSNLTHPKTYEGLKCTTVPE
uniref:Uncharacterized protein isoform X1 n=2 Tax=Nicotiana tabacum TaxID=4097 RepID=A0A1S3ZGI0_TOBAC|nr:PREDICTED: uncharacterized protein LOC107786450 isoform X1 [Nicotiana tabacum]